MNQKKVDKSEFKKINRRKLIKYTIGSGISFGILNKADANYDNKNTHHLIQAHTPTNEISKIGHTPYTKFSINCETWFQNFNFVDRIKKISSLGFNAIEFWSWRNKNIHDIVNTCKNYNIKITQFTGWGFNPRLNDPKNHEKFIEEIKKSCEVAHMLKTKKMTIVAGQNRSNASKIEMLHYVQNAIEKVTPIAEDAKVMLIIEPMNIRVDHPGHCLYGSKDAFEICRQINSPMIKINWDLYHMQISEGDLCGHLKDCFSQIGYIQLADTPGRHEPGTGEIYFPTVLNKIWELGYRDYIGAECYPKSDEITAAKKLACSDFILETKP